MAAPDWDDDSAELRANLKAAIRAVRDHALARRSPTLDDVREWHRITMAGLHVPHPEVAGSLRGDSLYPRLQHCMVWVGNLPATRPAQVRQELDSFITKLNVAVVRLDGAIALGVTPNEEQAKALLRVAAWAHAEWVRIHPFANGNGRTARMWANWVLMRYGLPPVVRLRPRPAGMSYAVAAARAMATGDHGPMYSVLTEMFVDHMRQWEARNPPGAEQLAVPEEPPAGG